MGVKLLREYIRNLLIEQEEERTDLEKIQDLFIHNGIQAVELGEMVSDEPEVRDMRRIVDLTSEFLKLFKSPAMTYQERQKQRDPWNHEVRDLIHFALPNNPKRMKLINMMFELGQAYINLEGIIGFGKLPMWRRHIDTAAEWAGAPMPQIPETWPK